MSNDKYDILVTIGRMQPLHLGHKRIIDTALEKADTVLILLGSAGSARTIYNPWTYVERRQLILDCYPDNDNLVIEPIYDKKYNDSDWIKQIHDIIKSTALLKANNNGFGNNGIADLKIGLIGASKDNTSYYLKLFPEFESVNVNIINPIHATGIREYFLADPVAISYHELVDNVIPKNVADFLFEQIYTEEFQKLQDEYKFVEEYKKQWKNVPYPVKHNTVDCLVEQNGHILLIRRKSLPGKGLWALPGGHLNVDETLLDGAIRELYEETNISVSREHILSRLINSMDADDPHRSTIGRVISKVYHFKFVEGLLPEIRGADDAEQAKWWKLSDLKESDLFDDHWHIINYLINKG